ncbi:MULTISPECIES: bifunctional 4-hydroxy-2-oxoglutarate aldolase/2-dehydro-3-deoxy-phosphogluconate aldolase [unclassified Pseudoclavibacter]|uniref:bifunctional 4-hydroxy-2-oxoglutarate aldolase/2-dehydro-3-deoxy-phosphogluconate aldolase n=1 Tax=unclassified Pseudoclavibacter TaxID=2615177 RepID=UPI000CE88F0F|nr:MULTISPECIES: bifunctional 4-hydroxy-2-oxoglutarate aldolase/2-dehydro-3-deoxy-phosphogluconate aldolase [unclassified Pseudoclavibacter]PPF38455.1 keto-deoxy-phosphogluconate aldolase [Pseudoclavibacter sp. AY1H1]PPF74837.1 keto-deoxy-phosphogluconate aldolase [Pseudoclavibacter sp. Z016]PPG03316.1 keto-deoxy-phosphogluconate aldolase [Pseudoclavibacter sp. RFBI5]
MHEILARLAEHSIVPVVSAKTTAEGLGIAEALADGGLPVAEVTFRTSAAASTIAALAARGGVLVGAGTVLTPAQVDIAVDAGASFIVSPGLSRAVVERCRAHDIPVLPGATSATEVQAALELGIETVKFFPAETNGGAKAIAALSAPFGDVRFVPTGGVNAANLGDYLAIPAVLAVGGSWMLPPSAVDQQDWAEVTRLTAAAVELARGLRSGNRAERQAVTLSRES